MTEHNQGYRNKTAASNTTPLHILHQFPELRASNSTPSSSQKLAHYDSKASSQAKNNNKSSYDSSRTFFARERGERGSNHRGGSNSASWRAPEEPTSQHVNNERVNTTSKATTGNSTSQLPTSAVQSEKSTHESKATQTPPTDHRGAFKIHDRRDNKQSDKPLPRQNAWGLVDGKKPTIEAPPVVVTPFVSLDLKKPINPRVTLRYVVQKLVQSKLLSEEVEIALREYIHTQKITAQDKDICSMEDQQQQADALTSIAKKYPYNCGDFQGARNSPIHLRPDSKTWLQQKVEEELGPNVPYLITGPEIWNRLGLDTTNLYTYDLIYTTNVEKELEGLRLRFKKVNFELPAAPTPREWFVVDMCNNIQDMDITVQEFTARLRRLVVDGRYDPSLLQLYSGKFGSPQTNEIINDALLSYVHQSVEFAELIRETASRHHARDVVILRDYLITHVLYALQKSGHKVYLKGGCSLSLGYNLITRTSEDVDLRLDPSDEVMWEVNGKDPEAAENSRMAYFLNLIDSMLIEDGDVKLYHTKCKTTQAVYHVTFDFPRICHTPIAVVLEVMHKVAPFYEQCSISSKLHDFMANTYPEKLTKYTSNSKFLVHCSHPLQTLYEKIHAVYQNYNKFKRNDACNINAPKWIRHLGDAYTIIKHCNIPLPEGWTIEQLQQELAKSGDFVVNLTLDHPVLNLESMDPVHHAQVLDAYEKHLQDAYYGEVRPPNLQEVCSTVLDWLRDKPTDFMSYRVNNRRNYSTNKKLYNNYTNNGHHNHNGNYNHNKTSKFSTNNSSMYVPRSNSNNTHNSNNKNNRNTSKHAYRIDHQQQQQSSTASSSTSATTTTSTSTSTQHDNTSANIDTTPTTSSTIAVEVDG